MENPFELFFDKLNTIENLLRNAKKEDKVPFAIPEIFNLT